MEWYFSIQDSHHAANDDYFAAPVIQISHWKLRHDYHEHRTAASRETNAGSRTKQCAHGASADCAPRLASPE